MSAVMTSFLDKFIVSLGLRNLARDAGRDGQSTEITLFNSSENASPEVETLDAFIVEISWTQKNIFQRQFIGYNPKYQPKQ